MSASRQASREIYGQSRGISTKDLKLGRILLRAGPELLGTVACMKDAHPHTPEPDRRPPARRRRPSARSRPASGNP